MRITLRAAHGWPACSTTFLLLPALTRAETAVQAWVQRYDGPANGNDRAYAMAVDRSNNVIVTGFAWNGSDSRLRDDQVFERRRAALDQPLQRVGERCDCYRRGGGRQQ